MDDAQKVGESKPAGSSLIRFLTMAVSALSIATITVNALLEILRFFNKKPMQPGERDRVEAIKLAIKTLRNVAALVRQARVLIAKAGSGPESRDSSVPISSTQ